MKEQLASLIETYAAARASGDATLQRFAVQQLSAFLQSVEITRVPSPEGGGAGGGPDLGSAAANATQSATPAVV